MSCCRRLGRRRLSTLVLTAVLCGTPAAVGSSLSDPALGGPRLAQVFPQQPPGNPWRFRPQAPTNARGVPPTSVPGQQPSQQTNQQPGQPSSQPPSQQLTLPPTGYPQTGAWPPYPVPGAQPPYTGTYPGQYPGVYPGPDARGYPDRSGYGPYAQTPGAAGQPSLEVSLRETRPYVQQPVLLQLEVSSFGNLATASPELAGFEAVLLEEVSGPTTRVRGSGRDQWIVNRYVLALTPLRDGRLEVGPFKVSGTLAGGVPFTALAKHPISLEVRPAIASVRPWLPLRSLELTRELDESQPLAEGRPTTLTLRLQAAGGSGEQLPDLEPMLVSEDFRAYREQTIIETSLSKDGRSLEGVRTEVYTLVPYSGGRLQLPEIRVNWWNIETARGESSSVPIRSLSVAGEAGPFGFGRGAASAGREGPGWSWFWMPVGGIALLLIGYWAGVWYRLSWPRARSADGTAPEGSRQGAVLALLGRGARVRLESEPSSRPIPRLASALRAALIGAARRLDPRPPASRLWQRLRSRARALVPASVRVYRCASEAGTAQSPSEWALRFQHSACQSLRTPSREPLPRVADRILRLRPGADGERVRQLIQELDKALYNGAELDMRAWKRELRRALRPGWGALPGLFGNRLARARLPALNPGPEEP